MWAAYDDKWSKNYLKHGLSLLENDTVDYIFPTFKVVSIGFKIYKVFGKNIFSFIETADRKSRVLSFTSLHHASHKCNIVYSLFRTRFIKEAIKKQGIENDGVLGIVIVGLGHCWNSLGLKKGIPDFGPDYLCQLRTCIDVSHLCSYQQKKAV